MMDNQKYKFTIRKKRSNISDVQTPLKAIDANDILNSSINLTGTKITSNNSSVYHKIPTTSFDSSSVNLYTTQYQGKTNTTSVTTTTNITTTTTPFKQNQQQMGKTSEVQIQAKRSVNELLDFFNSEPKKIIKPKSSSDTLRSQSSFQPSLSVQSPRSAIDHNQQSSCQDNFNKFLKSKIDYNNLISNVYSENDVQQQEEQDSKNMKAVDSNYESNKTIESVNNNLSSTSMSNRKRINLTGQKNTGTKSSVKKTKGRVAKAKNFDALLSANATNLNRSIRHAHSPEKIDSKRPLSPSLVSSDNDEVAIPKFDFKQTVSTPTLRKSLGKYMLEKQIPKSSAETPKKADVQSEVRGSETTSSKETHMSKTQPPVPAKDDKDNLKDEGPKEIVVCKKVYQIIGKLGSGGSCSVFDILDKVTKKHFALKVVDLSKHDSAIIAGFKEEINTLKTLKNCKKVVRFFDHEFRSNKLLIVMEKGELTFETLVKESRDSTGQLEPEDVRCFWKQMLRCVEEIHSHGIVHSDLKPANFIIVRGRMKLIDFGISKQIETDHTSVFNPNIIGSVDFMAPETVTKTELAGKRGVKYNQKADIWSLGIILFYLIYNRTPFEDFSKGVKLLSIKDGVVVYPHCEDHEAVDLLKFILQKEPLKRPTVEELLKRPFPIPCIPT